MTASKRGGETNSSDAVRVSLHVEEHGEGPSIVLLHGFGGSARNFRPQARALRDNYRVVLFDARGHARSEAPEESEAYDPAAFVEDLHHIVEGLPDEAVVVGGLSMGAGIALRYALAHPARVRGLLLAAFPPGGEAARSWSLEFADAIDREGLEHAGARFVWGGERFDPTAQELIRRGFLEHPPHGLSSILRRVLAVQPAAEVTAREAAHLQVPVALVAGKNDRPSVEASQVLADALPNAKRVVVADGGHVVNLSKPQLFNEATRDLLRKVEGR